VHLATGVKRLINVRQLMKLHVLTFFMLSCLSGVAQQLPTFSSANEARIVPPPPGYKFPDGEIYVYDINWKFFNAGTAEVQLESVGGEQKVTAVGNSTGFVSKIYKVDDKFESTFDPHTFCSLQLSRHIDESFKSREDQVHFDYEHRKSIFDQKNLKTNETKHQENDIPACVSDLLSGFYYVASFDLQPGTTHLFEVNDGNKTATVSAHVEGREEVKVPAGTFNTLKVHAEAISGALRGKGSVWVWYADNPMHTPVQMKSKLGWGTLTFHLQEIHKSPDEVHAAR